MNDENKTQLGKILLKRKLVSSAELDSLLDEQKSGAEPGERLASKVLQKGLTDEVRLLKALSEQAGVPAVNLEEIEFPLTNLDIIPKEIAAQHVILPIVVVGDSINLAMANPDDQRVIDEIEFVSGKRVFPHVALHAQIVNLVESCYVDKENGETHYRGKRAVSAGGSNLDDVVGPPIEGSTAGTVIADSTQASLDDDFSLEIDVELPIATEPGSELEPAMELVPEEESEPASLPVPEPQMPEPLPSGSSLPDFDVEKKILVVDDEDDIRLLISRVLTEKGYKVVTAGRGLEAIKMVQTENPDMIILDAMLPEVHGFDICKKIKGSKKYGHIPVIMISAIYRGWRYAQDLKDSYGVDDFIEKPFKLNEFLEKVEVHMSSQQVVVEQETQEDLSGQAERILAQSVEAYRAGDVDKAIELLRQGLKIDPLAFKLHYNMALLLGKKSLNYQAIRELESALELEPTYFPALKNLALLYQKAGFKFKSIETWERALHYCPDDETRDGIKQHLMNLL